MQQHRTSLRIAVVNHALPGSCAVLFGGALAAAPGMSLWPPGVVQRLSSQTPPQHVVQQPRAPVIGWHQQQYQQQHLQQHPQQQQLCLLLEQQQQQYQYHQLQQEPQWDPLQYVLQQQGVPQQHTYTPSRGLAVVAAAAAAAKAKPAPDVASPEAGACWPAEAYNHITDIADLHHELVQWPQDKQPKLGYITKNKLRKLTAAELRGELSRLQAPDTKGLKEDLINALLAHLLHPSIAAAAAAAAGTEAATGESAAAELVVLTAQGLQLLQQLAPAVVSAAQQRQGGDDHRIGLQVLSQCQVSDLQAALAAAWPLVQPVVGSREQLLAGSSADLVHKLMMCLAICVQLNIQPNGVQQQQQQQAVHVLQEAHDLQQQAQPVAKQTPQVAQQQPQEGAAAAGQAQGGNATDKLSIKQQLQQALSATSAAPPAAPVQQQQAQAQAAVPPGYSQPHGPVVVSGTMPPYDAQQAARVAAAVGVSLEELPPLAQQARGHVYDVDWMTAFTDQEKDLVLKANRSGLVLTLVGGAVDGALTGDSSSCCISVLRERDAWLFDVGEDTQRLIMWLEHIRPSKLHRIVVSRQSPDALLGLPGVLCVIGSSREKGHEKADIPVHVFAPEGTCEFLSTMYDCGNTFLEMPVVVHEFVHHAVSKDEMAPQLFNNRSKLWRVLLPPDQLNPEGYVDARLDNFSPLEGRARTKSGSRSAGGVLAKNPRAGYRPLPTAPPGDPSLSGLARSDMSWTIQADEAALLTAVAVEAEDLSWAMVWREADKQGNLSVPRCQSLGISNAELYGVLKTGEAVQNDDGITIPAYMVCTQDKPGRKVVVLPACDSATGVGRLAADADVMFADAAAAQDAAAGAPLGAALGACAREWGVRTLITTGMPQGEELRREANLANNWFNPVWRAQRMGNAGPQIGSRSDSEDEESDASDQQQQQDLQGGNSSSEQQQGQEGQQPWVRALETAQADARSASFLQAVSQEYSGMLVPGRDCLSLIVEENSGKSDPEPLDMKAKEVEARATSLVMCVDALDPANKQLQPQQRQQGGGGGGGYKGRSGGGQQRRPQQGRGQYQQRQGGGQRQQQWQQRGERSMAR